MLKVAGFIERNSLDIKVALYLIITVIIWSLLTLILPLWGSLLDKVNLYFLYFSGALCIIYLCVKKPDSFVYFTPIRFIFFYFLFRILIMNIGFFSNVAILNRQKYDNIDEFIIETCVEDKEKKITFIEKVYRILFK